MENYKQHRKRKKGTLNEIKNIPCQQKGYKITNAWCIMSSHIHLIISSSRASVTLANNDLTL
jgi:REP element-mobilizing transposase RayT